MNDDYIKITEQQADIITKVLSESQKFMREQKVSKKIILNFVTIISCIGNIPLNNVTQYISMFKNISNCINVLICLNQFLKA